jgi:putative DNA primase/helicase
MSDYPFQVAPFTPRGNETPVTIEPGRLPTPQESIEAAHRRWPQTHSIAAGDGAIDYISTVTPVITIVGGNRHIAADKGLTALMAAKVPFYQRDGKIQRIALVTAKNTSGDVMMVPGIVTVEQPMMGRALGRAAMWQHFDLRKKAHVSIDPPQALCAQILSMVGEWPFLPLQGIIQCPTLRRDGTLLNQLGYDDNTGLVLVGDVAMPPISPEPTRDEAIRALNLLRGLLIEFPIVDADSLASRYRCS